MNKPQRIELVDFLRGVALIAMAIFHFAFDLELLGVEERGFVSQPHWKYFARCIASSFLFLVGFSLYLSHSQGIRWDSWRKRMLLICGAALLITIVTYFATPDQFIFFGILHAIAFASVFGLLFINAPILLTLGVAAIIIYLGNSYRSPAFNDTIWLWTGLNEARPNTSDYVPVFPWMGAPLIGIIFAKLCDQREWLPKLASIKLKGRIPQLLEYFGRHSLVFYLVHQPIMIAILYSVLWVVRG